jgi:hypothetical protein
MKMYRHGKESVRRLVEQDDIETDFKDIKYLYICMLVYVGR